MKIVIVGTGALGGLYASRFAKSEGTEVFTICRSNFEQVNSKGFEIDSDLYGNYCFVPNKVFRSIEEAAESKTVFDLVVVTLKNLPELGNIAKLIEPLVHETSSIVIIQNGIDIERPFHETYPNNTLISCVSMIAVSQIQSGKLIHKEIAHIGMGLYPKPEPNQVNERILEFGKILKEGGVSYDILPDIECLRWFKLQWNCSFSPISILTGGCDTYHMYHEPEVKILLKETMEEIRCLSEAVLGYPQPSWVPYPDIDEYIKLSSNIHYKPSLLLDYERKNPLELEITLGNLVHIARRINHPVPRVAAFYALLKLSDKKNRGLIDQ